MRRTLVGLMLVNLVVGFASTAVSQTVYERSKVFGVPSNLQCDSTHTCSLTMTLANRSDHSMNVVMTLYNDDGTVFTRPGNSGGGLITNITLNDGADPEEVNVIPSGQALKFRLPDGTDWPSSGKIKYTVSEDVIGLIVNGRVATWSHSGIHRYSANILVNSGQPF